MVLRSEDITELRRQEDRLPRHLVPDLSDQLLGMPAAIGVGGIPVGNPGPIGGDQRILRLSVVVAQPSDGYAVIGQVRPAMAPGAEADDRDLDVRATQTD